MLYLFIDVCVALVERLFLCIGNGSRLMAALIGDFRPADFFCLSFLFVKRIAKKERCS